MKTRLYILVLSAILVAALSTPGAAESDNGAESGKKKVKVILVPKQDRDRSGSNTRTEGPRPKNHSQR